MEPNTSFLARFKEHRSGYWAFWLFITLFGLSLFAEIIANDKPLFAQYKGKNYYPVFKDYKDTDFGGDFDSSPEYAQIKFDRKIMPLIPFSYDTIIYDLKAPAPTYPDSRNWLGTDDHARDVFARVIYGFRLSVLFGLILTILAGIIGVVLGAVQGFFGGLLDLIMQRFIEIYSSMPMLYILIIVSASITPGFWSLLWILLAFSWTGFVGAVRAECLKQRQMDYVKAAKALGASDMRILFRHILPNSLITTITFAPFTLSGAITSLTALDFLGFGLPAGSPSLGELLAQGKANIDFPHLAITGFISLALILTLLIYIGEAIRKALNPNRV
jgi:microcin C transport system permease protein